MREIRIKGYRPSEESNTQSVGDTQREGVLMKEMTPTPMRLVTHERHETIIFLS